MGLVTGCKKIRISRTPLIKGKHEAVPRHTIAVQEKWIELQLSLCLAVSRGLCSLAGKTSPLCVTNIIQLKRNRSLNTTNGLLAKMESSYVTTCFGLHF